MAPTQQPPANGPMGRPRGWTLLMMLLIVLSCTSGAVYDRSPIVPGSVVTEIERSDLADEQHQSLSYLFYRNNPPPPKPTAREIRDLERDLAEAPPVEVEELRRLFANDIELLVYATRDSDGDGVLDYRISEYRGKFFEGDIDLDGDGVRNVYDAAPYDPERGGVDSDGDGVPDQPGSFADHDGDGIPDHLDWSRRKAEPMPALQTALFRDFGVILVERSARFSPELAQAADDALRMVFHEPMPTLRTIAVEEQLLISPDLGDNGYMVGQTQTLTVYSKSLEGAPPLVLFGLFIHEIDHAWQLAQDFEVGALDQENKRLHFPDGAFTSGLERYGWAADPRSLGEGYSHALYWPHFYATAPRYLFRGSSPAEWAEWFEALEAKQGREFLRSQAMISRNMVGPYAMTSPWEWHADYLLASVYNRVDQRLASRGAGAMAGTTAMLRARMLQSVQGQWARYDYRNAAGSTIDAELGGRFPIREEDLDLLIERYVLPLAEFPLLSQGLALEVQALADGPVADWLALADGARGTLVVPPELLARLGMAGVESGLESESESESEVEFEPAQPEALPGDGASEGPGSAEPREHQ